MGAAFSDLFVSSLLASCPVCLPPASGFMPGRVCSCPEILGKNNFDTNAPAAKAGNGGAVSIEAHELSAEHTHNFASGRVVTRHVQMHQDGMSFAGTNTVEPTRPFYMLDANTGAVIDQWNGIHHALVGTGTG